MMWALLAIQLLAVVFDSLVTARRLRRYGPRVELNPLIGWLQKNGAGTSEALVAGIWLPFALLTVFCFLGGLETLYAMLTGFRICFALFQIGSLRIERRMQMLFGERSS